MRVALCCIGRLENNYIREYVEYYKKLGVDTIFIYDNNHDGEEHFEDVLNDYIENKFVKIIDFRNKEEQQLPAYVHCYKNFNKDYDWIMFFDCDEFLTFTDKNMNIKTYLSQEKFKDYQMIHINWMCYDDNDLVYYENKPVLERFTRPYIPLDFKYDYKFPENNHIKSIIKCNCVPGSILRWCNPHTVFNKLKCCNASGNECNSVLFFVPYDFSEAYLRHFRFKTVQEWMENKQKRGTADRKYNRFLQTYKIDKFFLQNKKTQEKQDFIKKYLSDK